MRTDFYLLPRNPEPRLADYEVVTNAHECLLKTLMTQGTRYHAALREAVDVSLDDVQVLLDVHEVLSRLVDTCRARVLDATDQPHGFTHGVPRAQNPFEITRGLFFVSSYTFQMVIFS